MGGEKGQAEKTTPARRPADLLPPPWYTRLMRCRQGGTWVLFIGVLVSCGAEGDGYSGVETKRCWRVLAVELAWAMPWRNNGPQEPGMVQAGRTSETSVRSPDRQVWCRCQQAFSELGEKTHEVTSHSLRQDQPQQGPREQEAKEMPLSSEAQRRKCVGLGPALHPCFPPRSPSHHGISKTKSIVHYWPQKGPLVVASSTQ